MAVDRSAFYQLLNAFLSAHGKMPGQNLDVVGHAGNLVRLLERMGCAVKKLLAFVLMMSLACTVSVAVVGCGGAKKTTAAGGTTTAESTSKSTAKTP
jgi:hypothetical protein